MTKKRRRTASIRIDPPTILAGLVAAVLLGKWAMVRIAVTNPPWSIVGFAALLFVLLSAASVVGLFRAKSWGFVCAYLLVPVSTLVHGIALVPFITELLPSPELKVWAVIILNVIFLAAVVATHLGQARGTELRRAAAPIQ